MLTLFGLLAPWIILARQLAGGGGPEIPTQAYYTTDDGVTWFADDINKIPPFEKDGKPAYRVHVFRCADGKDFVSHLERYTPQAKLKLEQARSMGKHADPGIYGEVAMTGVEVKKPGTGDSGWVKITDYEKAAAIMSPRCADGTTNGIEPVFP